MAGIRRKLVNTNKEKEFHLKFLVRHGKNQRWDLTTRIILSKAYRTRDKRVQRNHPDYGRYNEFIDRMEALVKLKAIELLKDRLVITFANYKHHFMTAVDDIYFGNCQGTNKLSGSRIAIVGTLHVQTGTYVMVAAKLGLNLNPTDFKTFLFSTGN